MSGCARQTFVAVEMYALSHRRPRGLTSILLNIGLGQEVVALTSAHLRYLYEIEGAEPTFR